MIIIHFHFLANFTQLNFNLIIYLMFIIIIIINLKSLLLINFYHYHIFITNYQIPIYSSKLEIINHFHFLIHIQIFHFDIII